jgi:nucleoid-associated protein YgaU/DNA-binding SARP family transcriptional activator
VTGAEVARSLSSLALLIALTIGLPLLLVVVAPISLPNEWPSLGELWSTLMRPDDGRLFLGALKVAGWGAWAWFAISVLVQLVSDLRGLPAPHLPVSGAAQRGAAVLLTSAALLFSTGGTGLALGPPLPAAADSAPLFRTAKDAAFGSGPASSGAVAGATEVSTVTAPSSAPTALLIAARYPTSSAVSVDPHPRLVVHGGDTLWGLAERHLGRGERFIEIYELNHGRPQADGRTLTDAGGIYPGWILRMPTDSHALPAMVAPHAADGGWQEVHQVVAGETLWGIAEDRLGDAARYREIYDLNVGAPQTDGGALADPGLIKPGWFLTLPPITDLGTAQSSSAAPDPTQSPLPRSAPAPKASPSPESPPDAPSASALPGRSENSKRAPDVAKVPGHGEAGHRTDEHAETAFGAQGAGLGSEFFVGLTALTAAGFVGEIARRRRRQQRLRRTGQRIAMPEPGTPEALAERRLRHAPQPVTIADLRRALHHFGPQCVAAGRDLPRVGVVLVSEDRVVLLLTEDDPHVIGPFTTTGNREWTASPQDFAAQESVEDLDAYPEPYPALVCVGVSGDAIVLVNLEAAGLLALNGPDDIVLGSLRGIASELVTSAMIGGASVMLAPDFTDLVEAADAMLIRAAPNDAALVTSLERTADDCRAVIAAANARDALHARSMLAGDETWNPVILVGPGLTQAVPPWAGYAAVTTDHPEARWRLDLESGSRARLEPFGVTLRPQHVTPQDYAALIDLLRIGGIDPDPDQHPEPPDADAEISAPLAALPSASEQALLEGVELDVEDQAESDEPDDDARGEPELVPIPELQPSTAAPRVLLLGPVEVTGTTAEVPPDRARRQTELVAFLALHHRATVQALEEIIGEGGLIGPTYRNTFVSRTRSWLGVDADRNPYLPIARGRSHYELSGAVSCDWSDFQRLAKTGLSKGMDGANDLRDALRLVRGRPFADARPNTYEWADPLLQEMTSRITDVAQVLARMELEAGELRAVAATTAVGLLVDPCNEKLFRLAIRAAHQRGDRTEVNRLIDKLRDRTRQIDPGGDFEQETVDLLIELADHANNRLRATALTRVADA